MSPSILILLLLLAAAGAIPTTTADSSCDVTLVDAAEASCQFECRAQEQFSITATILAPPSAPATTISAQCGGEVAPDVTCPAPAADALMLSCTTGGAAQVAGVGECHVRRSVTGDTANDGVVRASCGVPERFVFAGGVVLYECRQSENSTRSGGVVGEYLAQERGVEGCTSARWILDQPGAEVVRETYEFQYPGCAPPGCRLAIAPLAPMQVHPSDPTAPFYKGPPSNVCTQEDVCYVAENAQANLIGWNGTSIIQCVPGTQGVSFFLQSECSRGGFNIQPFSTKMLIPRITTLKVPFGECVAYSYTQVVEARLILGPLGETYNLPPFAAESGTRQICNGIRSPT